jgi:pimeloyl-ACP methyl ester carboxylesterase
MIIVLLFAVLSMSFLAGCSGDNVTEVVSTQQISPIATAAAGEGVDFTGESADFKQIKGTFYDIEGDITTILVHMLGKDRSTWAGFVPILLNQGYNVVTIDLRGHGDSSGEWKELVRQEFADMHLDVGAATKYLSEQGVDGGIVLIGASIGANAALKYAASDTNVTHVVLLSPGLDYRGLTTSDTVKDYSGNLFITVSEDDIYARQSGTKLYGMSTLSEEKKEYKQYDGKKHGTDMFSTTTLADDIIEWLRDTE